MFYLTVISRLQDSLRSGDA